MRQWVNWAVGARWADSVRRLRRSVQRNSSRYDLFVEPNAAREVLTLLESQKQRMGWYVRMHVPFRKRQRSQGTNQGTALRRVLASWNVNSVRGKRDEICWYLHKERVAVLALQETLHKSDDWRMRLGQYQCITSPMNEGRVGERGVALAIAPDLVAHETGSRSPFWIWARVLHPAFPAGLIVGSVYVISHHSDERREMLDGLRASTSSILKRHAGLPVVIMGDWNMDGSALDALLQRWGLPVSRMKCRGSVRTRWRGKGALRDLDHIVASTEAHQMLSNTWVNRAWDISDHWPVHTFPKHTPASCTADDRAGPAPSLRLKRDAINGCAQDITCHNMWEVLEREVNLEADGGPENFLSTSIEVARQTRVAAATTGATEHTRPKAEIHLSRKSKRAIEARRRVFRKWDGVEIPEEKDALWSRYLELKRRSKKLVREEKRTQWDSFIAKGAKLMVGGEWRRAWKWIKCIGQRAHTGPPGLQPIVGKDGTLHMDPAGITNAWAAHYAALAGDATGHSKDPVYWESKGEELVRAGAITGLNGPIAWDELHWALRAIKSGKAPGDDGLPPEWFKVMVEDSQDLQDEPRSPMGRVFLRVIRSVWERASVPDCWSQAVLVSIPKKGDPTNTDNYRGISLMGVALKLLCMVVTRRMRLALEARNVLVPEQAGFRSREECMGQAIALYEVVTRRKLCGQPTYATFIDFKKAYDTVPHEALLRKLWCVGVQGRTLAFIRSLYQNSRVAVRVGTDLSDAFPLERGLRQGCPMSPLLFDVFINDILRDQEEFGVTVPGVERRKLSGLLFADDVVVLAPDESRLRKLMHRVEAWADEWEMSVGARKCGVTVFGVGDTTSLRETRWTLQGQEVPVVESYTYLGVDMHHDLDLSKSAKAIHERVRKALMSLRPALVNSRIPVTVKACMIKSLIMPIATLGGELLGMNLVRAGRTQSLIHKGLGWVLRGDRAGRGAGAMATVGLELGIAPLHALQSGRRARAWTKYGTLRTWIATLTRKPFRNRKTTWVSGTSRWMKRFRVNEVDHSSDRPEKAKAREVTNLIWERTLEKDTSVTLKHYRRSGFKATRDFTKHALQRTDLSRGIRWLVRMRGQAVWTGPRAARAGLVDPIWGYECPCCGETRREDIAHILLECSSNATERARWIQPLVERIAGPASALQRAELATLILGGQVSGVEHSQHAQWWLGDTTHTSTRSTAPYLQVAEFLQCVMPQRMGRLWSNRSPQAPPSSWLLPRNARVPSHVVRVVIPSIPGRMSRRPNG